jgi:uncharacterized protein YdaU (DUF1376 family)
MHYYSFHVSDYIHDTAHLTNEEDLAYRRLLDLYYTQEKPIPNRTQEVARRIRMGKNIAAVQTVLEEFFMFSQEHDFWFHKRCDETIAAYQAKAERNRAIGKLGGRPKSNPEETQTVSKHNPNQEPITNNHKPIKEKATIVATPVGVSESVWDDFKTLRKAKKAPITKRAIDGLIAEANKAGWSLEQALTECCVRGWQAFKAEWVADKPKLVNRFDVVTTTVPSRQERDPALVKIDEDSKKAVPPSNEVLQKLKLLRGRQ